MIDLFNEVGILTSVANNRTTIHTINCLAFWFVDGQDTPIRNPHYQRNPVTPNQAVQGNANPMSAKDNGNSPIQPPTSSTPVSSMADASGRSSECHPSLLEDGRVVTEEDKVNNDEREENKLSPYGEDGQLPVGYLEKLDEGYTNLPVQTDEPCSASGNMLCRDTPSMPNNPKGIPDDEGSTNQLVSPIPSTTAADAADSADYPLHGSD